MSGASGTHGGGCHDGYGRSGREPKGPDCSWAHGDGDYICSPVYPGCQPRQRAAVNRLVDISF